MTIIGPKELAGMPEPFTFGDVDAPAIPFSEDVLNAHKDTHVLIYTPSVFADGTSVTINALRERLGVDPSVSEPCMYNQDWYLKEDFAAVTTTDNAWHLIRKEVLEDARAQQPQDIEESLPEVDVLPHAVTLTFTFFAYCLYTKGDRLWNHDFSWCSDRDHNGDRIYVGRYEDPSGTNNNGFNIHRHLALRPSYSVSPEIKAP